MKTKTVPLTWNAPGARWSAGLQWNGTITTTQTMNTKAVIDFSTYTAADLTPVAQTIHDQMTANAVTFPSPPTSMAALATLLSTYSQKLAARASNASADVLAFNIARNNLEVALHDLGVYVNLIAKGDPVIVEKSGFPSYNFGAGATPGPSAIPAAPANVKLRAGDLSGSFIFRCTPDRPHSFNVLQTNTGNPNDEASWKTILQFTGGKATVTGQTTGTTVWARAATVGANSQLGAWSDPAKIVVQ